MERRDLGCNGYLVWVGLRAIRHVFLAGQGWEGRLLCTTAEAAAPEWVEKPKSWMMGELHVHNRTSIRESIDGTLGGMMRPEEFEGKLGQFVGISRVDETTRVRREARTVRENSQSAWGKGLWVVMAIRFLIEVKEYLHELDCFALQLRLLLLLRMWIEELESWMRGDFYVPNRTSIRESIDGTLGGKMRLREFERKLGQFARLLLRLWVEEPEIWMREDLHVPNRTSIRESIDGTLGGKMRLREFKGKLRQFAGILRVDGEKGFGL
ncbi:Hypothetical predicted protein [Olea europaea subsp. europaea]|uniref:Uncharacterized protein n=1 Tax=Olea europaea subsp. europaea TaxID=158383 RepID=A0A8S0R4C5_OLEEU|nr:Hypothetical predicted protein [Olea europaea subsp. europaea]